MSVQEGVEPIHVHVAFERVPRCRIVALRDEQVDRRPAGELDVGTGGVEMRVVRDDLAGATDRSEQDLFRRPSLMGRDDVPEREEILNRREETKPRWGSRVALVAVLNCCPLVA